MKEFIETHIGFNKNNLYNLYGISNHFVTVDFGH